MTPILEFLACELGKVTLIICPSGHGFSVQLTARGIDSMADSRSASESMAAVASSALADYRARRHASLRNAESIVEGENQVIAAIDELMMTEAE